MQGMKAKLVRVVLYHSTRKTRRVEDVVSRIDGKFLVFRAVINI